MGMFEGLTENEYFTMLLMLYRKIHIEKAVLL